MPIITLSNDLGKSQNIEVRNAVPQQPIFLKSISWFYKADGGGVEIDNRYLDNPLVSEAQQIMNLYLKFNFLDNIDVNGSSQRIGMIPVSINNQSSGIQYYDVGFLPSEDIEQNVSMSIHDENGSLKEFTGKIYFNVIFQYNRNEIF